MIENEEKIIYNVNKIDGGKKMKKEEIKKNNLPTSGTRLGGGYIKR